MMRAAVIVACAVAVLDAALPSWGRVAEKNDAFLMDADSPAPSYLTWDGHIVIDEVDAENGGYAGVLTTEYRRQQGSG